MSVRNVGVIKKYCDTFLYKRGERCYEEDYVVDLSYDDIDKNSNSVSAKVLSSSGFNEYLSCFIVNKENLEISDYTCTCGDFEKRHSICKHLVAGYLKFINEVNVQEEDTLGNILNLYKKPFRGIKSIKKYTYTLDVTINNSSSEQIQNFVELKVGIDKLYVVKSMTDFLKAYYFKQSLEFGKNFVLDFSQGDFSKEDSDILDFFVQILEVQDTLISSYDGISVAGKKLIKNRRIYLIDAHLKRLLKLIGEKSFSLVLPIGTYENVNYVRNVNIDFSLEKEDKYIMLYHKNNELPYPLTRDVKYFYYKGNVCGLPDSISEMYTELYKAMLDTKGCRLKIDEKHKIDFASFMIPRLKCIGDIEIKEELRDEFYKEELNINIFLDKEFQSVILNIMFVYGDTKINPLCENGTNSHNGILIRNVDEEMKALELINSFQFKERDNDYILKNEDDIVNFLVEGLTVFQDNFKVFYSESFKSFKVHTSENYKCGMKVTKENMLEFSFGLNGVNQNEFIDIFQAIKNKKNYYKLSNGEIVLLRDKFIRNVGDIIEYLDISKEDYTKGVIKLPKYDCFYIEQKLNDVSTYISKNEEFINLVSNIREIKDKDYEVPEGQKNVLRPYQELGFKWFKSLCEYGFGGILADEMGLGKTLQTITFLESEQGKGTSIIVCPTSLVYNWQEEIQKFSNTLKVLILNGAKEDRKVKISNMDKYDVVITSYPLLRRDIDLYEDFKFLYCILDEAQQIKNPSSQNALSVKRVKAMNRFALTGTPIENNLTELWSIFDFIMPSYLLTHNKFYSKYEVPIFKDENMDASDELKLKIKPFILRRLKKDVIKELPPKIYKNILVDMNEEQKKIYASFAECLKKEIQEQIKQRSDGQNSIKILSGLTRLRQICCDPSVFIENYNNGSGKLDCFYEILQNCIEEGHRVLVFSQFTSVLKNMFKELSHRNIEYLYLDGAVKSEDRIKLVNKFNNGHSDVFLISLKAGGSGLNLTSADVVIHFDPWWNPAVEEQATDRVHRIGQKNSVQVIKLLAKGSIEEKILKLQDKKKQIVENTIENQDLSQNTFKTMDVKELLDILSIE